MSGIFEMDWLSIAKELGAFAASLAIVVIAYSLAARGLKRMQRKGALAAPVVTRLRLFVRWGFFLLAILLGLDAFGVLEEMWAALIAVMAMVAVGFVAVWSVLSNAFCTLLVLIYRPYQIGDSISLPSDNIEGEVIDLNLMFTTLRDKSGKLIQVPNNTFFQKPVVREPSDKRIDLYDQLVSDGSEG